MSNTTFTALEASSGTLLSAWVNVSQSGQKIPANVLTNPDGTQFGTFTTPLFLSAGSGSDFATNQSLLTASATLTNINNKLTDGTQRAIITGSISIINFPSTQSVTGSINVINLPPTQSVTGSINVINFPPSQVVTGSVLTDISASLSVLNTNISLLNKHIALNNILLNSIYNRGEEDLRNMFNDNTITNY
jgi:hypothetical protein